ncbi:MAG: hypothetical protein SFV54_19745 [Bryobacteraceae bacterium]|nr:hypothetical protein [Bryobacteraceae bacterium]
MPDCAVCGRELVCTNPHPGNPPQVGSVQQDCPIRKGAIWIYVKDDTGTGVAAVEVEAAGITKPTDPTGFAPFDPLDENTYTTKVKSLGGKSDSHYVHSADSRDVTVSAGKIQMVTFELARYSTLKVIIKRTDKQNNNGYQDADVSLAAALPAQAPVPAPGKTGADGTFVFQKVKKGTYDVTAALKGGDQPNFDVDGKAGEKYGVDPSKVNEVEVPITPNGWVKLHFKDAGGAGVKGVKVVLKKDGEDRPEEQNQDDGLLEVKKLTVGDPEVVKAQHDEVWEFVELTSA